MGLFHSADKKRALQVLASDMGAVSESDPVASEHPLERNLMFLHPFLCFPCVRQALMDLYYLVDGLVHSERFITTG